MKVGIMQPYFLPYIGYFQLINAVDKFVIYDDVNYIKGGWINRNNILIGGSKKLFTIKLKGASQNKLINEIEIGDDFRKFMKTIHMNYSKAPYYFTVIELMNTIISFKSISLSEFIENSIKEINSYLQISTSVSRSSKLTKNTLLKGQEKVIDICKVLEADTYINSIGGQGIYDFKEFASNGIMLKFLKSEKVAYPQFQHDFIENLSMLDVLMFNSVGKIKDMLDNYKLI